MKKFLLLFCLPILLSCRVSHHPQPLTPEEIEEPPAPKISHSYKVRGRTYHVLTKGSPYDEVGLTVWYGGKGHHGRKTSSGELLNDNDYTAAHRTLALGTKVRVTDLKTGNSVVVRINDRGPFNSHLLLDLSKAAARKLGILHRTPASVRIQSMP